MRKKYIFGKKLYISILTTILILLTTVATTFAWIGVFANSTFDTFDISVKSSSLEEYGVLISASGKEGTFSDSIDEREIKRQILKNWGKNGIDSLSAEEVDLAFSKLIMHQCTNLPVTSGDNLIRMGQFKTIENTNTTHFFKFEIYVLPTRYYEASTTSNYLLDVFLGEGLISGTSRNMRFNGDIVLPTTFNNPLSGLPLNVTGLTGGETIREVSVNSKSACRVAFEKYDVVPKYDTDAYENKTPVSTVIYSGDSYNYPTYDSKTKLYEFGGILPEDTNVAVINYNKYDFPNSMNGLYHINMNQDILQIRGVGAATADRILSSNSNHIIDSANLKEQISLDQMMKMTVYFWIEGWDADCFNVINQSPVTLSISLNVANEDVF